MNVIETIKARHATHGNYADQSRLFVSLTEVLLNDPGWQMLSDEQKLAMMMFCVKMSRIMSGNPNVADHWHDIAGYAALVENKINDPHDLFDFVENASEK